MSDLLIRTLSEFMKIKETIHMDPDIHQRYQTLFSKYDCFSLVYNSNCIHSHKPSPRQYYKELTTVAKRSRGKDEKRNVIEKKSLDRTILGILNVINQSNYVKNLNKIRINATQDTIAMIIQEILMKCCLQIFYLKIFVRLIADMMKLSGYGSIISQEIDIFVKKFINEKEYIFNGQEGNHISEYDLFCKEQTHKAFASSKNFLILELFNENILEFDMNQYISHFIEEIKACDEKEIDLLINIMLDIMKKCGKEINENNRNYLKQNLKSIQCSSMKTLFLRDELIDLSK